MRQCHNVLNGNSEWLGNRFEHTIGFGLLYRDCHKHVVVVGLFQGNLDEYRELCGNRDEHLKFISIQHLYIYHERSIHCFFYGHVKRQRIWDFYNVRIVNVIYYFERHEHQLSFSVRVGLRHGEFVRHCELNIDWQRLGLSVGDGLLHSDCYKHLLLHRNGLLHGDWLQYGHTVWVGLGHLKPDSLCVLDGDGKRLGHSVGHGVGLGLLHGDRHRHRVRLSNRLCNVDPNSHCESNVHVIRQRLWESFSVCHSNAVRYNKRHKHQLCLGVGIGLLHG